MVHYLKGLIDNMTPGWKSLWNTGVHGLFGRGGGGGGGGVYHWERVSLYQTLVLTSTH